MPGDFFDNIMDEIESEPEPKTIKLWRWVAAAACIMALVGIGCAVLFSDKISPAQDANLIAENTETVEPEATQETVAEVIEEPEQTVAESEPIAVAPKPVTAEKETTKTKSKPIAEPATDNANSGISNDNNTQTIQNNDKAAEQNYPSPALMDEFIAQLADNQGASKTVLDCSLESDGIVELAYVFPVKSDFDLFGRLMMSAVSFPETAQGYALNYSQQQFIFSLTDERNEQNYMWIAERVGNDKIFVYSTHSPIGTMASTDCYQQYHSKLINANINTYTNL